MTGALDNEGDRLLRQAHYVASVMIAALTV
jgi:hypothetical protein